MPVENLLTIIANTNRHARKYTPMITHMCKERAYKHKLISSSSRDRAFEYYPSTISTPPLSPPFTNTYMISL